MTPSQPATARQNAKSADADASIAALERPSAAGVLVEHLDRFAPRRCLRGIDLAEIEHMPLHHAAVIEALVLHHVPVVVRLAVLLSLGASQKHDATNLRASPRAWESGRSSLQLFFAKTEDAILDRSMT